MATISNPRSQHVIAPRTVTQKVCIGLGIFFVVAGIAEMIRPDLLGLHLSATHNVIHLVSGVLAIWSGYADDSRKAFNFVIGFGVFFALIGVGGFVMGEPGYPGVGYMAADNYLWRVYPNVLEFGTVDHAVHILVSAVMLVTAVAWRNEYRFLTNSTENFADLNSNRPDLRDAELGQADITRLSDYKKRTDSENRV